MFNMEEPHSSTKDIRSHLEASQSHRLYTTQLYVFYLEIFLFSLSHSSNLKDINVYKTSASR